ncbi:MAG: 50S ribosomal protein L29 [Nitrospirae bacterium]|nr:50S ribosomal protein L29 [Candidatus Manganitrophaceae bacterium]
MEAKDYKEMTVEELAEKEKELRKELFNLRFQAVSGHVENPNRMKQIKREIARLMTFSGQKKKETAEKSAASK